LQALIDRLESLRENSMTYGSAISDMISNRRVPNDPRYGCFFMIHNKATLTTEVLDYFLKVWKNYEPVQEDFRARLLMEENTERCVEMTRSLFIGCMSVVEHCAKRSLAIYPDSRLSRRLDELRSRNRYIFLKGIIQESGSLELIPKEQETEWVNVMLLRNIAVHNNSISDTNTDMEVGGRTFNLRSGEMMRGDLDTYVLLSERSMELFHRWICKLDYDAISNPGDSA
jgi:hypothetical protein